MSTNGFGSPVADDPATMDFDETWYLEQHADVAEAVAAGHWKSGYDHYRRSGRARGRLARANKGGAVGAGAVLPAAGTAQTGASTDPLTFDAAFYGEAYPLAQNDIMRGRAAELLTHYRTIGRFRGYLPNKSAIRPDNPAAPRSRFGGFWIDQGNALDLLDAREELGLVSTEDSKTLRQFITDGYTVLRNVIPDNVLDRAEAALGKAYNGGVPNLKFAISGVGERVDWQRTALTNPAKALDLHWMSPEIRDLALCDGVLRILHMIMERRVFASQTLGFWHGSAQEAHQDSAYVNYSHRMQFLATWIALEDVTENSGELFYYVGSQNLKEYLYLGAFKGVEDAARMHPHSVLNAEIKAHIVSLPPAAEKLGLRRERFIAKRGDVLIWNADLAHGGSPISTDSTRKSVVTHYCPAEAVPSYFENKPGRRLIRHGGGFYSTGHYDFDPIL